MKNDSEHRDEVTVLGTVIWDMADVCEGFANLRQATGSRVNYGKSCPT